MCMALRKGRAIALSVQDDDAARWETRVSIILTETVGKEVAESFDIVLSSLIMRAVCLAESFTTTPVAAWANS